MHSLKILVVLLVISTHGCTNSPRDEAISNEVDSHTITLADENEPGQRLTVYGLVVDSLTSEPIKNAKVYLYHADSNGEYMPADPDDESTAQLSGEVITNDSGEFVVHTIVPREYDNGNQHIHLHYVRADGYMQIGKVVLFEHDVNDEVRKWAYETGFGIIIELYEKEKTMYGNLTIPLLREKG